MIKALENPHFKKIWEALYPNLLAGRESELSSFNGLCDECLLVVNKPLDKEWHTFKKNIMTNLEFKFINQDRYDNEKYIITQILGRPITLEDILILLSDKAYSISIPCFASNIIVTILSGGVVTEDFIDWQLGKPIYEQSENTWEKISELI